MTDDEFPPLPDCYDVKPAHDPFAQFPSEHGELDDCGVSAGARTRIPEPAASSTSSAGGESVSLFGFASEEEPVSIAPLPIALSSIEPSSVVADVVTVPAPAPRVRRMWWPPVQARLAALMAACVSVARSLLQWLSIHTWNAIIAVIGFVCAVLIVSARLSVVLIRRNAPYVRQGARASAMWMTKLAAIVARLCVSAAVLSGTLSRRTYAFLQTSFPVVRASATRLGQASLRSSASLAGRLLRRDVPVPAIALRHYAYPAVFVSGVVVGVLVMVGRGPSNQAAEARAATPATRTDVALAAAVVPIPATPQSPRVDNAVPTSGVDGARQNSRAVVRVAASAPPVRNQPAAQVRAASRAPLNSTAPGPGRSRAPARVVPAGEREDDRPSPGAFRGSFAVGSRPEGAEVFLNGKPVGRTPLVLTNLPVGSRAVRVTLDGHQPWSRAVQVVANQRTTVTATLQRSGSN